MYIYMGVFTGGGGHSDAKWEIFQFSPFFSKMSFVGGGMLYLFEISKKWPFRKGMGLGGGGGGGWWPYFGVPDPNKILEASDFRPEFR